MEAPMAVRMSGPLTTYLPGFRAELAGQGYQPGSARTQLELMAQVSRWLGVEGLTAEDLDAERVQAFLRARSSAGYRQHLSSRALVPLTSYLTSLGVLGPSAAPSTREDLVMGDYRRHLIADRGLVPTTVAFYVKVARRLLAEWGDPDDARVGPLSARQVSAFVVRESGQLSVACAKTLVTAVRSWLRFLRAEGYIAEDMAGAVPGVAGWRGGWIPRGASEADVAALFDNVDPATTVGLRDRAVLVLLHRLALRVGEVARLVLDDIDWRDGEIIVRGKGNRQDRLPLPVDVGDALVAYLRGGRAEVSSRALFLRAHAPITGLTPSGVSVIVRRAAQRAGVRAAAHQLRHTTATAMLRAGGSLVEVGQVLRHTDALTTLMYAKVDYRALVTLAKPWPGSAA